MNTTLTHRGLYLLKSELKPDKLRLIRNELSVSPYLGDYADISGNVNDFEIFYETPTKYIVPRYWGIEKFGIPTKINFKGVTSKMTFNGSVRDYQVDIINTCLTKMKESGGGLLSVGCGRGKTVMAINIACRLEAKTLVVVHKTFLQDQWIERIKQFTNARIGIIRQDIVDIENKDIVIAMLQSISMRDYDLKIFDEFKLVIYDEAHHCASKIFSKALYKTGANYTLALSATPERTDKLKKVMDWYLGPTLYKEDRRPNKQVLVKFFKYNTIDPLFKEKLVYRMGDSKPCMPLMINNLVMIKERNEHIINMINSIRKIPDRKILILSGRREHLTYLKDTIDNYIKIDIENKKILENECKTFYYFGGMKKKDRMDAEMNSDILFGTYEMAHEGLDIDRLNTVILATPKKNIIQSVGRVMRKILTNGDLRPLIIDFTDELSIFKNHGERRIKDYKSSNYKIENYFIDNSSLISHYDYMKKYIKLTDKELTKYKTDKFTNKQEWIIKIKYQKTQQGPS